MHDPIFRERVRLVGVDEVYVVASVDRQRQAADLLPLIFGGERLRSVPFASIEKIAGDVTEELVRRRTRAY